MTTPVAISNRAAVAARAPELHELSDLDLVQLTKDGDTEAFSTLVGRHQHLVYNLSYRFMRDSALAEDMAQEAFLKAYRLLSGFRGDCNFSTWMYRVTASVCLSELARRRKRNEVEFLPIHEGHDSHPGHDSFDLPDLIHRCVGMLPSRYEIIVSLYYFKEISYEEIAQMLEIPMGTLKTWMHRARNQLRKIVEKELHHDGKA